jgi:hypothetical protein
LHICEKRNINKIFLNIFLIIFFIIYFNNFNKMELLKFLYGDWGLGIGDWGLGIGDWAQ